MTNTGIIIGITITIFMFLITMTGPGSPEHIQQFAKG